MQTYHSQSQPKRSSKAIKIIDPSTREEVSMEGKTSTETNSSSSIITQPPPATVPKNDVAALFQIKVQGALNHDSIFRHLNLLLNLVLYSLLLVARESLVLMELMGRYQQVPIMLVQIPYYFN